MASLSFRMAIHKLSLTYPLIHKKDISRHPLETIGNPIETRPIVAIGGKIACAFCTSGIITEKAPNLMNLGVSPE